jgi:hypothetical protein
LEKDISKMIEPRTISMLNEAIEREYSWRISELSNFKSSLLSEGIDKAQKAKIRAGVALLYAHWEGFVKNVANLYYSHVSFQNINIKDLNDAFVSILLRGELHELTNSKSLKIHQRIVNEILSATNNKANFPSNSPIRTSNLRFSVFEDVCILIAVDPNEFETRYKRDFDRSLELTINEDLVDVRNSIAHGVYFPVKLEEFKKLYDIVVNGFLYNFKEIVLDSAQNKKYLR